MRADLLTAHQRSLTLPAVYARYPIWLHLWFLTEALCLSPHWMGEHFGLVPVGRTQSRECKILAVVFLAEPLT